MNLDGYTLYQVLGAVAVTFITGAGFWRFMNWVTSGKERGVAIDDKVSGGWRRYAEKLEKQMDIKDTEIREIEGENVSLRRALRNAQTTVQITSDVKALETKAAKEEIHEAVDASIDKMTP